MSKFRIRTPHQRREGRRLRRHHNIDGSPLAIVVDGNGASLFWNVGKNSHGLTIRGPGTSQKPMLAFLSVSPFRLNSGSVVGQENLSCEP